MSISSRSHTARPERRRVRSGASALLRLVVVGCIVLWATVASAEDGAPLEAFQRQVKSATKAYDDSDWSTALEHYEGATATLEQALADGVVPRDARPRMQDVLVKLRYQIARCHQNLDACDQAFAKFQELRDVSTSDAALTLKLDGRLAETGLCVSRARLSEGDLAGAVDAFVTIDHTLAKVRTSDPGAVLGEDDARQFVQDAEQIANEAESVRAQLLSEAVTRGQGALVEERCADAQSVVVQASRLVKEDQAPEEFETLRERTRDQCGMNPEAIVQYAQWGLIGTGGALILSGLIVEFASAGDVDALVTDRRTCVQDSDASACASAVDLADSLETRRTASITLVALGSALAIGGGVWLLVDAFGDDETGGAESSTAWSASIIPLRGGGGAVFEVELW